jgi:glutathione S-transferase
MYRLFAAPNSYAMVAHSVLEELGVAYELAWVEIFTDKPDPAFLAVHEHGTLYEAGAIALYLAERHPEAGLTIPIGDPDRGKFLQWLSYLASTLQPDVMIQFHPEIYLADADDKEKLKRASMERLGRVLDNLNEALEPGPYFFADRLTVCDFVLGMQATWPEVYPRSIDDYPNLKRLVVKVTERPSVRRVLDQHGLDKVAGS